MPGEINSYLLPHSRLGKDEISSNHGVRTGTKVAAYRIAGRNHQRLTEETAIRDKYISL